MLSYYPPPRTRATLILTLTILCQLCIGASFALACRYASARQPFWRAPGLLTLLSFQGGLVIPPCAYTLWRFPETVYPNRLGPVLCAAITVAFGLLGFLLARWALVKQRLLVGWGIAVLGLALLPLGVWLHSRQDLTGVSVRDNAHMVALWRMVWPIEGLGWIFCLWRLSLYDTTQLRAAGLTNEPSSLAIISAEILSVVKPSGARPAGTRVHKREELLAAKRGEPDKREPPA